jgi:hypothetical protein
MIIQITERIVKIELKMLIQSLPRSANQDHALVEIKMNAVIKAVIETGKDLDQSPVTAAKTLNAADQENIAVETLERGDTIQETVIEIEKTAKEETVGLAVEEMIMVCLPKGHKKALVTNLQE